MTRAAGERRLPRAGRRRGRRARRTLALLGGLLASVASGCGREPSQGEGFVTRDGALEVFVGSRLLASGSLVRGRRAAADDPLAAMLARVVAERAAELPFALPPTLELHFEPFVHRSLAPVAVAQMHLGSGALLLTREVLPLPAPGLIEHELAHVAMRGHRPSDRVPRRLVTAVEEAAADVLAGLSIGSAAIAAGSRWQRDLSDPPRGALDWEALALPGRFDPHALARPLASELWTMRGEIEPAGLIGCFHLPAEVERARTLSASLPMLLGSCSEPVRAALRRASSRWLPPELASALPRGEYPGSEVRAGY